MYIMVMYFNLKKKQRKRNQFKVSNKYEYSRCKIKFDTVVVK